MATESTEVGSPLQNTEFHPPRKSLKRRRWLFVLFAVFTGLLVGLVLTEVLVRLYGLGPPRMISKRQLIPVGQQNSLCYYHCYPSNPHGEFRALPDIASGSWRLHDYTFEKEPLPLSRLQETPWCVEYCHSSMGIRDREYSPITPKDKLRLAVVGDSFVFGEGVAVEQTLPRQLETILGSKYECINAGQVGANAEQELDILNAIVGGADCKRVILVLIPNDMPLTPKLAYRQKYINDFILIRDRYLDKAWHNAGPLGHLRLFDYLTAPGVMRQVRDDTLNWYRDSFSEIHNGQNLAWFQEQMNLLAARKDCEVVVVLYPLLEDLDNDYPLRIVHEVMSDMVNRAGLPLLDLSSTLAGQKSSSLWVHETDHHPNAKAQKLAASAIADWLVSDHPDFLNSIEN